MDFIASQIDGMVDPLADIDLALLDSEPPPLTKDGKPPRPPNAWILYRSDRVRQLAARKDAPKKPQSSVSKELSEEWKTASVALKTYYERLAEIKKAEHERRYPDYQFCPVKKEERDRLNAEKKAEKARQRAASKKKKTRYTPYPQRLASANHTPYYAASASYGPAGPSPPASGAPSPCTSSDESSDYRQAGPSRSGPSSKASSSKSRSSKARSGKARSSKSSARSTASSSQPESHASPGSSSWPSGSRGASPSTSQIPTYPAATPAPQPPAAAPDTQAPSMQAMQDKFFLAPFPGSWQPSMPPQFETTPDSSWNVQPTQSEFNILAPQPPVGTEGVVEQWSGPSHFPAEAVPTFPMEGPLDQSMDVSQIQPMQDLGNGDFSMSFDIPSLGSGEWGNTDTLLDESALGDPLQALMQTTGHPSVFSLTNIDFAQLLGDAPLHIDVALQGQAELQAQQFEQILQNFDSGAPFGAFDPTALPTIPEGQQAMGADAQNIFDDAALMQFLNFDAPFAQPQQPEHAAPPAHVQAMSAVPVASTSTGYVPPAGATHSGVRRVAGSWKPPVMSHEEPVDHAAPQFWGVPAHAN
ncbi:hypothetical protein OBBRIDRAFT_608861 [Obba rivulosa]|uniref:HMG box domain-containing protein n=1 Tax=Obba rivulosa TaxID=1052685 RepID=A0A8E2AW28_9APHY|nr:hypothetical protein OBBRIDRAFT_608861 [Obba rivulosa]